MNRVILTITTLIITFSLTVAQVKMVAELEDVSGKISHFEVDNNNQFIAAGNDIGILTVWDFSSREELFKTRAHKEKINFIVFNGEKQVITFSDDEISFIEIEDGTLSQKIELYENIDLVDVNTRTHELYLLASRKAMPGTKSIYFINLENRKFGPFHTSVSGIESFKTSRDGKIMYIAKGSEILVKNIDLDIIDKSLVQESKVLTIDINPAKPNWLVSTDRYQIKYWKVSSGNKYTMHWKALPTIEDRDRILNTWILNEDNKILIQSEHGFKIRDVTDAKNEVEIASFIGQDIRDVQLSPDKATILVQIGDNTIKQYSYGEPVAIAANNTEEKKPAVAAAATETAASLPTTIDSSDGIYAKYKNEIDDEIKLRSELFVPRGEFERTSDYATRKAEADNYKQEILKYYRGLANREAEVERELALARQKILDDQTKADSERKAALFRDKIKKSYAEYYTSISAIGKYNTDTEEFPITIDGITLQVNVPFDKARGFKENYSFCKVVGNRQYLEDAATMDKFNYRIVTDTKDVYEFGKQKEPLFITNKNKLYNGLMSRGLTVPAPSSTTQAAATPAKTKSSLDAAIVEYFSKKTYHALLIGVNEYQDQSITQLDGPVKDAMRLKRVLKENYTFEEENITLLSNPTRTEIIETFDQLQKEIGDDDNLIVFYAGHGIWDPELKQGFWLPSDAKKNSKAAWLSNATIRDYIGGIKTKHTLLISDACFSGGIFKSRSVFNENRASLELAKLPSRKAITSGAMKTVPDKSVFIEYLVKRLYQNERDLLPAEQLFSSFKIAVMNNSEGQVPQFGDIKGAGDEGGDFVFLKRQ
jgi:Caspase domain